MSRSVRSILLALIVLVAGAGAYAGFRVWNYTQHDPAFCRSCHLMQPAWEKWESSAHSKVECHACHQQSMYDSVAQLAKFVLLRPETIGKHADVDYQKCSACHLSRDPRWKQVAETAGHKAHFARKGLECVSCHSRGVHRFVRPTDSCKDCHASILVKSKRMDELHCTSCHKFLAIDHELRPTRQQCLDCHGVIPTEATFPLHGAMKFECSQCHKPHREGHPMSAGCASCHEMDEKGLHGQVGHRECVTCHHPHDWKPAERKSCEACHSDKGDHNPDQPCALCHSFQTG